MHLVSDSFFYATVYKINDLASKIKKLDKGISIGGYNSSCLLYTDDIVIYADNEDDLQAILDLVDAWCRKLGKFH